MVNGSTLIRISPIQFNITRSCRKNSIKIFLLLVAFTNHRQRYACCACGGDDGDGVSFRRDGVCLQIWGKRPRRPFPPLPERLQCGVFDNLGHRVFPCEMLERDGDDSCCAWVAQDRVSYPRPDGKTYSGQHLLFLRLLHRRWKNRMSRLFGSRWTLLVADSVYHYVCFTKSEKKKKRKFKICNKKSKQQSIRYCESH